MSTKHTLAHGDHFHFYHEIGDDNQVYLELENSHFEAGYNRVMVPIPIHIWETIRHFGRARLGRRYDTDEDMLRRVRNMVDLRINIYEIAMREDPDFASRFRSERCLVYGAPDEPREAQIEAGLAYYRRERQRQQDIKQALAALRAAQYRNPAGDPHGGMPGIVPAKSKDATAG
jgi:hypothetical protein